MTRNASWDYPFPDEHQGLCQLETLKKPDDLQTARWMRVALPDKEALDQTGVSVYRRAIFLAMPVAEQANVFLGMPETRRG